MISTTISGSIQENALHLRGKEKIMAKCFMTGVELPIEKTYLLDVGEAHRALKHLRQRTASVERLIGQLGALDDVEIYDAKKHANITRKDKRLICESIAKALAEVYPEKTLFVSWGEWRNRRTKAESQDVVPVEANGQDSDVR